MEKVVDEESFRAERHFFHHSIIAVSLCEEEIVSMPSFETSDHVSTRSVLRHRPIGTRPVPTGKHSVVTRATAPVVQRASRPRPADATDDVWHQGDEIAADERETYPPVHTQPGNKRALMVTSTGMPQTPRPR